MTICIGWLEKEVAHTFGQIAGWGGAPLRVQFPRLFDMAESKWVTVQEMERRGWVEGSGAWV